MMDVLARLLGHLITIEVAWIATWLFPVRNKPLFWALMIASCPFAEVVGGCGIPWVNLLFYLANYGLTPYLFWRGPRGWRLVFAAGLMMTELAAELEALAFAAVVGPTDIAALRGQAMAMVSIRPLAMGTMLVLGLLLRAAARRITRSAPSLRMGWFAPFFVLQMVLMVYPVMVLTAAVPVLDPALVPMFAAVFVGCLLASVAATALLARRMAAEREQLRAEEMHATLDACLDDTRRQLDALAREARLRHDRRNHMQALDGLLARGEMEEARRYVAALRAQDDAGDEVRT